MNGRLTVLILAAAILAAWTAQATPVYLQLSDETRETNDFESAGTYAVVQFEMPAGCDKLTQLRYYATASGQWNAVLFDDTHYKLKQQWFAVAGSGWHVVDLTGFTYQAGRTFFIGVQWIYTDVPGLGVDKDTPWHPGYNWFVDVNGQWYQANGDWDFMLGVYADGPEAGLAPTSLGRVKAMWR